MNKGLVTSHFPHYSEKDKNLVSPLLKKYIFFLIYKSVSIKTLTTK